MSGNLKKVLAQFKDQPIIIWGDFILDEYIYTSTSRISREAPVIITEFETNSFHLGGAGNVAMNIKALGGRPLPVGLIGDDADGERLKELLQAHQIETKYMIEVRGYKTAKKSRILSGGDNTKKQQVLRIDTLNKSKTVSDAASSIGARLKHLLLEDHVVLVSDYLAESVKADVFHDMRQAFPDLPFIVDSRKHLLSLKPLTVATPNEPEIKKIFPGNQFDTEADFYHAGLDLMTELGAEGIILKRGHNGMIVFEQGKDPKSLDIFGSADIVDVTGAGDTVISVVGLARASGAGLLDAGRLANMAAGLAVMKEGAYPISNQELANVLD